MGILDRLLAPQQQKGVIDHASFGIDPTGYSRNYSGVYINEASAMTIAAVWACVRVLAESLGSLPVHAFRRLDRGRRPDPTVPAESLIDVAPNQLMSSVPFREYLTGSTCLNGNGYAAILRDSRGIPGELWPLSPQRVRLVRRGMSLSYDTYSDWFGQRVFPARDMLHIPGLTSDGIKGLSPITAHRQAIGLSKAAEEFGARLFGQGIRASGVVQHPNEMSDQAYQRLKESLQQDNAGLRNAHRALILEEGAQWSQLTINPDDAQFLESRKFQVNEIARIYRIPPHMIGDLEKATFSNIEQQSLEFVVHTLLPWVVRWEKELNRKLLPLEMQRTHFFKFSVDGLLRGDIRTRYLAYGIGRQWGWLSANDVREIEDMNPIPNGDVYLSPSNMQPADSLEQATKADEDSEDKDAIATARALRRLLAWQREAA